jgi:hypothetical protein
MRTRTNIDFTLFIVVACALAASVVITGCREPAPPPPPPVPFKAVVDVKALMNGIVDPSADVVWASVAIHITEAGEDHRQPRTDEEWTNVRNHAMMLAESGNLLMMAPRAMADERWTLLSRALLDTASQALAAAERRDAAALLDVGGSIYDVCASCHHTFMPPDAIPDL